jgi:pimeloyl-ACP methyl ester carboxylesterase
VYKNIVGYYDFHADENFNFQLNRWLPFLPENEVRDAANLISDFEDWRKVMWKFAERAESEKRFSEAAFYYRAAEFFMLSKDPQKQIAYDKFVDYHNRAEWSVIYDRVEVPYESAYLPALVVEPKGEAIDTLVVHGGFDSFAEELIHLVAPIAESGFRVILFEGPGQGLPLKKFGMPMTPAWEKPVGAVLDHFGLQECSLLGISLGGCLATRAAAMEPRVKRVIADDVLEDFFDVLCSRMGPQKASLISLFMRLGARKLINRALQKAAKSDNVIAWSFDHGMHVSGTANPFEYLQWTQQMSTKRISHKLTQDYLLLGAKDDHLIPLQQFYQQAESLTNLRSFTSRLFTSSQHASSHCQIGNQGLANRVIRDWLVQTIEG